MDDRIIICKKDDISVTAVFSGKVCNKLYLDSNRDGMRIGDIYVGRIDKLVDNVKAAFVNIGTEQNVYVPYEKMKNPAAEPMHADGRIHEGDRILVQIERMPAKNKPATAVADISLVGCAVILFPGREGVSFSKKIEDSGFRDSMKQQYAPLLKEWQQGIMFRTNSPSYTAEVIHEEILRLKKDYESIRKEFTYKRYGERVYKGLPAHLTVFRDAYLQDIQEIVTQEQESYDYLKQLPIVHGKNVRIRTEKDSEVSLYHLYDLKKCFNDALSRKVWLKSGGFLVFDVTEALTVIDVNSGKASANKGSGNSLHQINLEAAEEILHQIRLRNLSGIILVDFINTDGSDDADKLMQFLKEQAQLDRGNTIIVDITKLGLVEITRVKTDAPLSETVKKLSFQP